jgi:hypothetical protein
MENYDQSDQKKHRRPITIGAWPKLLTIELAAQYIGLAPKTLRNRLGRRAKEPFPVKPRRQGRGKIVFLRDDLDKYAAKLPVEAYE